MLSEFAMFRVHERTVPYSTIARMSLSNVNITREEADKLRDYTIQTTWKYEEVANKLQDEKKKVKKLEGQLSAPKTQPGMVALEKEKEKNRRLQNALDELQVKYDNTAWRLHKAEAKIREMEKAKVMSPSQGLGDIVVAPDGFAYVKMQAGNENE